MNELELIARLTGDLPLNAGVVVGAGDDCAVLDVGLPDRWLLFKTDAVVEGIHFTRETTGEQIGHKALGRCLSDIAAMAGEPGSAVVTLALPPGFDPERVAAIYRGLTALARRYGVAIVGGETTTNPERILISVALLGTVEKDRCTRREGAQPGDALFVTGDLGGSLAGKHLSFEPRLREARWLAHHFRVHAMIDLSDGLASDLRHLLRASRVGAELLAEAIPISRAARQAAQGASETRKPLPVALANPAGGRDASPTPKTTRTPLLAALTDGEDFELLFAVASRDAVPLLDAWKPAFPELRLSCIGKITAEPGVTIRDRHGLQPLPAHGYVHFA